MRKMSSSAEVFTFDALAPLGRPGEERQALQSVVEEARELGHAEGLAQGLAEVRAQLQPAASALAEAIAATAAQTDEFLIEAERAAVGLALKLAEKIVGAAIDADPEAVLGVISGALRRATVRDHLVLEVNPADFQLVHDLADELAVRVGGVRRLDVVAERRVSRGGCVVRTEDGEIDARIEEQLERAGEVVAQALRTAPADD
jgi:flagellar biosynthesis/type III secretory pathway protein FliH